MSLADPKIWYVGLEPRLMEDGKCGDFKVSERRGFALSFWAPPQQFKKIQNDAPLSAKACELNEYEVHARVVHMHKDPSWWVLDFGIQTYLKYLSPSGVTVGNILSGKVKIEVDDSTYMESLSKAKNSPPLIYDWKIIEITERVAPIVKVMDNELGTAISQPDYAKAKISSVSSTADFKINQSPESELYYVLKCELLGGPRKSDLVTPHGR